VEEGERAKHFEQELTLGGREGTVISCDKGEEMQKKKARPFQIKILKEWRGTLTICQGGG